MRIIVVGLLAFFSLSLFAMDESEQQKIQQRIKPEGQVHVQDTKETPSQTNATNTKAPGTGQRIYEQHCIVCHRDGLVGAPKWQNGQDWKSRLAGRTIEDLVASSIKGLNAMPAKGTCIECSDVDLKAAINYMLPNHD